MRIINKVLEGIMIVLVGAMVIGCSWQVITRFVLNNPSKYTEEFLKYALIWLTMMGTPYTYGQKKHLAITFITGRFKPKNLAFTKSMITLSILALSIGIFIIGGILVTVNSRGQVSPAMQMPMEFYYIGLPIAGVLMVLYCLEQLSEYVREWKGAQ